MPSQTDGDADAPTAAAWVRGELEESFVLFFLGKQ
jgi:hypothetical protein